MQLGQFHQAQRCYEYVSKNGNANSDLWARLAQTALARGDLDRAGLWAQKAILLKKDHSEALIVMAYISFQKRQYRDAEVILRRLIKLDNKNTITQCLLGKTLEAQGQTDEAIQCYQRARYLDPKDPLARKLLTSIVNLNISNKPAQSRL